MKAKCTSIIISVLILIGCTKQPTGEESRKVNIQFLTEEFYPISFIHNGRHTGMAVDLLTEAGKILKIKPVFTTKSWSESYELGKKEPNIFLFPTTMTKERADQFYWLKPSIKRFKAHFYKRSKSNLEVKNLEEAKKYKIATIKGYFSEEELISKGFTNLKRYDTPEEAMKALLRNRVDLAVFTDFRSHILVTKAGYSVYDIVPVLQLMNSELYVVISKKTPKEIYEEWQEAFRVLARNKTYYKLYEKWFLRSKIL